MKLVRVGPRGDETPAVIHEGAYFDLRPITDDISPEFLGAGGVESARKALRRGSLPPLDVAAGTRLGPPISYARSIITIATNYYAHAQEAGRPIPEEPVIILKSASSLSGPYDEILLPPASTRLDWEAELGIIIGAPCFMLGEHEDPLDFVAGFVTANDFAERDYQFVNSGNQWGKGKSFPTFTPIGPWLVTPDEVSHRDIAISLNVNESPRQRSSTSDMIFDSAALVSYLSRYMLLAPGDLILTGTPEGVAMSNQFPYLNAGDTVEVELAGLGRQRTRVIPASQRPLG